MINGDNGLKPALEEACEADNDASDFARSRLLADGEFCISPESVKICGTAKFRAGDDGVSASPFDKTWA
jgi:hypothetical protein